MQIKCLVVDDEPLARRLIQTHIEKLPFFSDVCYCKNAIEAMEVLRKDSYDLLLLDVQMPELNGISFLKTLPRSQKVVLITAFRDFAVDAFELDVIDYLVKPISFERFVKAINKYLERTKSEVVTPKKVETIEDVVLVRADRKVMRISIGEIFYVESIKDYVKIHLRDKFVITKEPISSIQSRLEQYNFVRIHRSYLVAIQKVAAFNAEFVEVKDKQLPYGRTFKEGSMKQLNRS